MAEFCKVCFLEKMTVPSDNLTEQDLEMSDIDDLCESCNEIKPFVLSVTK